MPKFNVHLYVIVRVEVPGVEAEDAKAACRAAYDPYELRGRFEGKDQEFDDGMGCDSYLVDPLDESGEPDYEASVVYLDAEHVRTMQQCLADGNELVTWDNTNPSEGGTDVGNDAT